MRWVWALSLLLLVGCSASSVQSAASFAEVAGQVAGLAQGASYGSASGLSTAGNLLGSISEASRASSSGLSFEEKLVMAEEFIDAVKRDPQFAGHYEVTDAWQHVIEARSYADMAEGYVGAAGGQRGISVGMTRAHQALDAFREDLIKFRDKFGEHHNVSEVIANLE